MWGFVFYLDFYQRPVDGYGGHLYKQCYFQRHQTELCSESIPFGEVTCLQMVYFRSIMVKSLLLSTPLVAQTVRIMSQTMSPRTAHLGIGLCKCRGDELVQEFGSILILLIDCQIATIIPDNKAGMILELSIKSSKIAYMYPQFCISFARNPTFWHDN